MRYGIFFGVIILLAAGARAEAPGASEDDGLRWGEMVDGLRCALTAKGKSVPEGAELILDFRLKFNREEGDRDVKFLNRYLDARRVKITFQNNTTGDVFERFPEDGVYGIPPDMVKEDIAVMHKPLATLQLRVGLVSPDGHHIPPGNYSVGASYRNDTTPDVKLYKGGDILYDGPWRFWEGTVTSPPVSLRVRRVKAGGRMVKINSALDVRIIMNGIGWSWGEKKPKAVRVKRRPGYIIGKRYEIHVFVNGEDMEYGGHGLATSLEQDGKEIVPLPKLISQRVANGEPIKLRADIELFETSVPAKKPWKPRTGDYRALWKGRIEGKLDEEVQKTLTSLGNAL